METSTTDKGKQRCASMVAEDTTPVGEAYKDYWARLARDGDLRAPIKLAACYEMAGEMDNGLAVITDFLTRNDLPVEIKSEAILRKAVLEIDSPSVAWRTIARASLQVAPALRWKLHNQRGRILKELRDYDPAIIEYTATAHYAELAKSRESVAIAHNNLASIYRIKKMYSEAHESVDLAIRLLDHNEYIAHAYDQKSLIYIDEQRFKEAHAYSVKALQVTTDQNRWRAEFLCTLAKAEAGMSKNTHAIHAIETALEIAGYLADENLRLIALRTSKIVCGMLYDSADEAAVRLALNLTGGKLRQAAKKLDIGHPSLIKSIKKYSIRTTEIKIS